MLRELGVRCVEAGENEGRAGFVLRLALRGGDEIELDLPLPGPLGALDAARVGVAVVDPLGYVRRTWGMARKVEALRGKASLLQTPLAPVLEASGGKPVALYLDGVRYYAAPARPVGEHAPRAERGGDVFVLVVEAEEERAAKRSAARSERFANALKRVGKVLAMNQPLQQICVAAAHEITSAAELAAVAIWTPGVEGSFKLAVSAGISRTGQSAIESIDPERGSGCVAELVGSNRQQCYICDVGDHIMTAGLEAKFCYLSPGGLLALPLLGGGRLLGILELIGKAGEAQFADDIELFETFAEHLALALNAASMYETVEQRAAKDALTGIANHRTMQEFLARRVAEAKRTDQPLGVLMLDVDHFRAFNEEEGHDAGDEVLIQVSETLRSCVRPYDLAARYGGEEFTVVMPGNNHLATLEVAERIRARVEADPYVTRTGRDRHLTVSIGCAWYPYTATEPRELLKAADHALYLAKRAGRNRVELYDGEYREQVESARSAEFDVSEWVSSELREASDALVARTGDDVEHLADRLPLSTTQSAILSALLRLVPSYRKAEVEDRDRMLAMEADPELRVLIPSLHALDERFDGEGPRRMSGNRIPLLARVLHVLLALEFEGGEPFISDAARFDPEIVSMLGEARSAA